LDVREILRRLQLGQGDRAIARDLTLSRKTVTEYRQWAAAAGPLTGTLPEPAAPLGPLFADGGGRLRLGPVLGDLLAAPGANTVTVKASYWLGRQERTGTKDSSPS
jgi:hypothetical protein